MKLVDAQVAYRDAVIAAKTSGAERREAMPPSITVSPSVSAAVGRYTAVAVVVAVTTVPAGTTPLW